MAKIHDELEAAKQKQIDQNHAIASSAAKTENNAISLLHDKENNSELIEAKRQLDEAGNKIQHQE